MALRIGKKKDAPADAPVDTNTDDWSEAALLGQTDDTPPAPTTAVATTTPDSADEFVADNFEAEQRKKSLSPALLAGGLVLLLTALGVGAYFMFFNTPTEEDESIVAPQPRVARAPVTPTPIPVRSKATVPAKKVSPGKAGIASPNIRTPAIRPAPGKTAAVVPKPNTPTPVPLMPDGMAAQPGKGSSPGTTVQIVRPVPSLTPSLQAQLKALWNQGAAAKHERNYDGARRAWQKMLQLRPGHPGVQEAIDKLPR